MKRFLTIRIVSATAALLALTVSCRREAPAGDGFNLEISMSDAVSKSYLAEDGSTLLWSEGDVVCLNGMSSDPMSADFDGGVNATFHFAADPGAPYSVVVPASAYASDNSIFLPSRQNWTEGNISPNAVVLVGCSQTSQVTLHHVNSYIRLSLRKGDHTQHPVSYISFYGNDSENVAGEFNVEYDSDGVPHLVSTSRGQQKIQVMSCLQEGDFVLAVPAMEFQHGFTVEIVDAVGHFMRKRVSSRVTLKPGVIYTSLGEIVFNPTGTYIDGGVNMNGDIMGRVIDTNGHPVAGVVISNGITCVQTDENGSYSLPVGGEFVYCCIPAGYEIPYDIKGFPSFYLKVDGTSLPYDFTLQPLSSGIQKGWTLCAMADPQVHDEDINRFASNIAADLKVTLAGKDNVYSVILGDVLWNSKSSVWDRMKSQLSYSRTGAHFFTLPGNHDLYDSYDATSADYSMYRSHFGPECYSFDRGEVHVVCLNNIITDGAQTGYHTGLTTAVYNWLVSDLSFVPRSKAVCLCMHANVTCSSNVADSHYPQVLQLLAQFADAYIFTGHLHKMERFSLSVPGGGMINEYNLAAAFGNFWYTRTNLDGTPGGYNLITFDGTAMTGNLLKAAGCSESYQIRCYDGAASFDESKSVFTKPYSWGYQKGYIVANVFNWNPDWKVELWQNGAKVCDMSRITSSDTRSVWRRTSESEDFVLSTLGNNRDWWQWCQVGEPYDGRDELHPRRYRTDGKPYEGKVQSNNLGVSPHLFKGQLPVAGGPFEVRATDPHGNTYTCSSFTSYTDGGDAWNWK